MSSYDADKTFSPILFKEQLEHSVLAVLQRFEGCGWGGGMNNPLDAARNRKKSAVVKPAGRRNHTAFTDQSATGQNWLFVPHICRHSICSLCH
jgi:hypothetical protein